MSIVREKLVKEDIELGHGIVQITDPTDPTGAKLSGHKVGIHTALEKVYNVMDFGATGDGSTDDTTAIQLAITTAGADSVILFPPGDYRISDALTITNSNVVLRGLGARWSDGNGSLIQCTDLNNDVLQVLGVDNVLIDNLSLRHSVEAAAAKYVIKVYGGSRIRIENCSIVSASGTTNCRNGIVFVATASKGISDCAVRACYLSTIEDAAIILSGYDETHIVSGVRIEDTVILSAGNEGLRITDYVREVLVDRCRFDSCGLSIDLDPTVNDASYDIAIRNCILNNSQVGEHIRGDEIDRVIVSGNRITVTPTGKVGISVPNPNCAFWQIAGNYIRECGAGGISLNGDTCQIVGNFIDRNPIAGGQPGITLGASSAWVGVQGNDFHGQSPNISNLASNNIVGFNLGGSDPLIYTPIGVPPDASLDNSSLVVWVDEGTNNLKFRVKYAGGTMKTGTVALI